MMCYKSWPYLQPGHTIELIAPSSAFNLDELEAVRALIQQLGFTPLISENLLGKDLFCANSDEQRLTQLIHALTNEQSQAIWCLRGGYGAARLLPALEKIPIPARPKLLIGFSDITALHLFLQQKWGWSTLHGNVATQLVKAPYQGNEGEKILLELLTGQRTEITYPVTPLNEAARQEIILEAPITGGNLTLLQTSIGTFWQVQAEHKFLLIEETNEKGYRVDRMLTHLSQAGIFQAVSALIIGDFVGGQELNGTSLTMEAVNRFAEQVSFPVVRCQNIGHGAINYPLPFGTKSILHLSSQHSSLRSHSGGYL